MVDRELQIKKGQALNLAVLHADRAGKGKDLQYIMDSAIFYLDVITIWQESDMVELRELIKAK